MLLGSSGSWTYRRVDQMRPGTTGIQIAHAFASLQFLLRCPLPSDPDIRTSIHHFGIAPLQQTSHFATYPSSYQIAVAPHRQLATGIVQAAARKDFQETVRVAAMDFGFSPSQSPRQSSVYTGGQYFDSTSESSSPDSPQVSILVQLLDLPWQGHGDYDCLRRIR
jgi:hypothetical protein